MVADPATDHDDDDDDDGGGDDDDDIHVTEDISFFHNYC
jgi:hypothetical protein